MFDIKRDPLGKENQPRKQNRRLLCIDIKWLTTLSLLEDTVKNSANSIGRTGKTETELLFANEIQGRRYPTYVLRVLASLAEPTKEIRS